MEAGGVEEAEGRQGDWGKGPNGCQGATSGDSVSGSAQRALMLLPVLASPGLRTDVPG